MAGNAGIPEQYWELIEQYRDELIGQALAMIGNREDAEDVVQQTFCDAFCNPEKLPVKGSMGAWLRSINHFNALTRIRSKRSDSKRITLQKQQSTNTAFTTGGFSIVELRETMNRVIQTLPPILREVVELRYWKNQSIKEISAALHLPQGTVQRRLYDANRFMHRELKSHFDSKPSSSKGDRGAEHD